MCAQTVERVKAECADAVLVAVDAVMRVGRSCCPRWVEGVDPCECKYKQLIVQVKLVININLHL